MFAEAEKQNEEQTFGSERTSENVGGMNCLQEMAQTGLFEKVKEKLFERR